MSTALVVYRTLSGVTATEHEVAAGAAHHSFLVQQEGFLGRVFGRIKGEPEGWIDMVRWRTDGDRRASVESGRADGSRTARMGQVDESRVSVRKLLTTYATSGLGPDTLDGPAVGCWVLCSWKTRQHVDARSHQVGNEMSHRAIRSTIGGFLGALMIQGVEGSEWFDLMAWSDVSAAQRGVAAAVESSHPAIAKHLSEADPATVAMHFVRPSPASGRVAFR